MYTYRGQIRSANGLMAFLMIASLISPYMRNIWLDLITVNLGHEAWLERPDVRGGSFISWQSVYNQSETASNQSAISEAPDTLTRHCRHLPPLTQSGHVNTDILQRFHNQICKNLNIFSESQYVSHRILIIQKLKRTFFCSSLNVNLISNLDWRGTETGYLTNQENCEITAERGEGGPAGQLEVRLASG